MQQPHYIVDLWSLLSDDGVDAKSLCGLKVRLEKHVERKSNESQKTRIIPSGLQSPLSLKQMKVGRTGEENIMYVCSVLKPLQASAYYGFWKTDLRQFNLGSGSDKGVLMNTLLIVIFSITNSGLKPSSPVARLRLYTPSWDDLQVDPAFFLFGELLAFSLHGSRECNMKNSCPYYELFAQ